MDYKGQRLSEIIYYIIILSFGAVGWVMGYLEQDFFVVVKVWAAGVGLAVLICVPDWPFYNRNPVKWLESVPDRKPTTTEAPSKK